MMRACARLPAAWPQRRLARDVTADASRSGSHRQTANTRRDRDDIDCFLHVPNALPTFIVPFRRYALLTLLAWDHLL